MEYNHIAILLTENCNARCKMCCDSRGQVCGHTLSRDELNIILENIKEYKFADTVGITGGEPLLYPELCEYIMNFDYDRDMKFTIKTNGFWGRDASRAMMFLEKHANKISKISFSYDEFHKEFIDISSIKNIIEICVKLKIKTDVVGCFLENGMRPGDVLNELGYHSFFTDFYYQPVIETGAALKLDGAKFIKTFDARCDELRCLVTARQEYSLLINARLKAFPCCSQCIENTILKVGDLRHRRLEAIIEDIKSNRIFHTIFVNGFTPFVKFMNENKIDYPVELSSPCEMCEFLFSSDWFLMLLEENKFYDNITSTNKYSYS